MVSFVILHYKNLKDTIECIESINKLNNQDDVSYVIVDNHSLSDEDLAKLKTYTNDIIINDSNLGFAKANNIGAKYAINKFHPDFLCIINNDIVIDDKDFVLKIYESYNKTNFDMMGPKILTDGGESVNPFPTYNTLEEVNNKIKYHQKLIKIYKSVILRNMLIIYMKTKRLFKKPIHLENGKISELNVSLHGCALIFSKKYYEKYDDVLYNDTFLYHEEEFLAYRARQDNLITYYDSNISLFHKEGSSLNESFKNNNYQKLIFRNQEILKSLYLLKDVMENNKKI